MCALAIYWRTDLNCLKKFRLAFLFEKRAFDFSNVRLIAIFYINTPFFCTHLYTLSCLIKFAFAYTVFDSEIAFAILLGPTDPCSIAVSMEPFSTLALKGLT